MKRWLQNAALLAFLAVTLGCVFSADAASTLINLVTQVIGILPKANGGTGLSSTATFPSSGTVATTSAVPAAGSCTNQVETADSNGAGPTCSSVSNAMLASVSYTKTVISGFCTGAASTSLAISLAHLGATATTCTTTSTTNAGWVAPNSGTVKNLYVQEVTTQKSGTTMAWTAQKCTAGSCSGQTLTCTVANAGTACNDTTHSFTVAAGDIVQIKSGTTASSSETMANVSVSMELWN